MKRILLGQLTANGDCAYATILARQLRHDHPEAHITWAVSTQCAALLKNNPDIDETWEIPVQGWNAHDLVWRVFQRQAVDRYLRREFDEILLSQIWPDNARNYDGTVRPSILRSLGRPITVPIKNVIRLTDDEIEAVDLFVRQNGIEGFEHRILFECSSRSGQSFITPDLAQDVAEKLYAILPGATVIFTTAEPMTLRDERSRYAGALSLREVAQLTHACSLFVGAGSGCTTLATSTAAKKLPFVLLLKADTSVFASFAHDFEYFGIEHPGILEVTDEDPGRIAACIALVAHEGTAPALQEFGGTIPVTFDHYGEVLDGTLLRQQRYLDAARSLMTTAGRYGWTEDLIRLGQDRIAPGLTRDPSWFFAPERAFGEDFRAQLAEAARDPAPEPRQKSAKDQGILLA
jgi:hypothetical protein